VSAQVSDILYQCTLENGAIITNPDGWAPSLSLSIGGPRLMRAADGTWVTPDHLCPDLLRYENIGAADGLRGRAVRAFFWLLRAWKP